MLLNSRDLPDSRGPEVRLHSNIGQPKFPMVEVKGGDELTWHAGSYKDQGLEGTLAETHGVLVMDMGTQARNLALTHVVGKVS